MGGLGTFTEPRLNLSITHGNVDLVSSKLPALQAYQLSIAAPTPPSGSFADAAAARGQQVFVGAGGCAGCHSGALFTDANSTLHPPADSMAEPESPSYAARSATRRYRTTPLRGVWQHAPYFHDGSAAALADVVAHYNREGPGRRAVDFDRMFDDEEAVVANLEGDDEEASDGPWVRTAGTHLSECRHRRTSVAPE